MLSSSRKLLSSVGCVGIKANVSRTFHASVSAGGFESFFDPTSTAETFTSGRAWTVPDLRRKVLFQKYLPINRESYLIFCIIY